MYYWFFSKTYSYLIKLLYITGNLIQVDLGFEYLYNLLLNKYTHFFVFVKLLELAWQCKFAFDFNIVPDWVLYISISVGGSSSFTLEVIFVLLEAGSKFILFDLITITARLCLCLFFDFILWLWRKKKDTIECVCYISKLPGRSHIYS